MTNHDCATIPGFERLDDIEHAGLKLPVFVSSSGRKPLIALHELPGMTNPFVDFCSDMVSNDYKVYMPLIFGEPNTQMGNLQMFRFCLSQEFCHLFRIGKYTKQGRKFPRWLLHLTKFVAGQHPEQDIGVVGMCLTGGFAIAAIADKRVGGVVACQPAYPFYFGIKTLGLTKEQRENCARRCKVAEPPCVKGYRYSNDIICRRSHMRAIKKLLGRGFEQYPDLDGGGHSTVTDPDPNKNAEVFRDILKFFDRQLG